LKNLFGTLAVLNTVYNFSIESHSGKMSSPCDYVTNLASDSL